MVRSSNKSFLPVTVALALLAIGLTSLPEPAANTFRATVHDATLPGHRLLGVVRSHFFQFQTRLTAADDDPAGSASLKRELIVWKQRCRQMEIASGLLREQLELAKRNGTSPYRAVATEPLVVAELLQAAVLGEESASLWRSGVLIGRGAADGLRESSLVLEDVLPLVDQGAGSGLAAGQPVYSGRSVIGKIAVVGRWTSTVRPVTDREFRGLAQLARKTRGGLIFGPQAILEGSGKRLCRLTLVPVTEPVSIGDEVYTGRRDATLPYPLYYGKVVGAKIPPGAAHWEIQVEPAIGKIEAQKVQVLTRKMNPLRQTAN